MGECFTYQLFDRSGSLLYVGCTIHPRLRLAQHRTTKSWGADIAEMRTFRHENSDVAAAVEDLMIWALQPFHNVYRPASPNPMKPLRLASPADRASLADLVASLLVERHSSLAA